MPNVLVTELDARATIIGTDAMMLAPVAGPPAEQATASQFARYVFSVTATSVILASGGKIYSTGGNFTLGAGTALATNATTGFVMVPSCAGVPSGAPVGFGAGNVPVIVDTTNFRIYAYMASGAWKMAQLA